MSQAVLITGDMAERMKRREIQFKTIEITNPGFTHKGKFVGAGVYEAAFIPSKGIWRIDTNAGPQIELTPEELQGLIDKGEIMEVTET